jgi:hypothetical protein
LAAAFPPLEAQAQAAAEFQADEAQD